MKDDPVSPHYFNFSHVDFFLPRTENFLNLQILENVMLNRINELESFNCLEFIEKDITALVSTIHFRHP